MDLDIDPMEPEPENPVTRRTLDFKMRLVGALLLVGGIFCWVNDPTLSSRDDWFCGITALLGVLTILATLIPGPKRRPEMFRRSKKKALHSSVQVNVEALGREA